MENKQTPPLSSPSVEIMLQQILQAVQTSVRIIPLMHPPVPHLHTRTVTSHKSPSIPFHRLPRVPSNSGTPARGSSSLGYSTPSPRQPQLPLLTLTFLLITLNLLSYPWTVLHTSLYPLYQPSSNMESYPKLMPYTERRPRPGPQRVRRTAAHERAPRKSAGAS